MCSPTFNKLLRALAAAATVTVALAAGCSNGHSSFGDDHELDSGGGGGDGGSGIDGSSDDVIPVGGMLRVVPAMATGTVREGTPAEFDFQVFFQPQTGAEREVTTDATFTVLPTALGSFTGAHFTSSPMAAGHGTVTARVGQLTAQATIDLQLVTSILGPGAPADAATHFGGPAATTGAPSIVYPNDGVIVPPNLRELEFHFLPAGYDLFKLAFQSPAVSLEVYFTCPESVGGGCVYTPDDTVWSALAQAGRAGDPVMYTLSGTHAADANSTVGTSAPRALNFAEEDITGGLYYWKTDTQGTDTAIMRYEFGLRGTHAERFIDTQRTGGMCVGCHALSRDGSRIIVGNATLIPTAYQSAYRVEDRVQLWRYGTGSNMGGAPHFATYSPDNSVVVFGTGYGLEIRNGINPSMPLGTAGKSGANEPDFAPDGNHIVYANGQPPPFNVGPLMGVSAATIELLERAPDGTFADVRTLVPQQGSENNYYPAFAPDGNWVAFIKSPSGGDNGNNSGNQPSVPSDAQLWVVSTDGAHTIQLQRAAGLRDSWPKWDPTQYMNHGNALYWLSWSSRRAYGLRYPDDDRTQLWMAAFDPAAAMRGEDPVAPPFRLPFQDLATGNHISQWVTTVIRQMCAQNSECASDEYCMDGHCYQYIIGARDSQPGNVRYAQRARSSRMRRVRRAL